MKDSSFMTPENKHWIQENTAMLIGCFFVFFTILMQVLHWCKVNVFKIVVLLGTFALALAFAGNDLVNFIGVPLAGYSSFIDYTTNGTAAGPDGFLMTSLLDPAKTPWYFLIGAGAIMVYALCTSKKAHNVIKTSVDPLARDEGEERASAAPHSTYTGTFQYDDSQRTFQSDARKRQTLDRNPFQKATKPSLPTVRRSTWYVPPSIWYLPACSLPSGTSLKLLALHHLRYFMVAMGTSLADRAWGRDSAVFRITGVLSVIGGWFITAGAAFTICFFVTFDNLFRRYNRYHRPYRSGSIHADTQPGNVQKRKEKEKGNATSSN